ncbi:hypothetical protein HYU50_02600 [Candidatus Woesearchaeota archaeon]|nr:hypothetical protein [Candidatus Woesearchaeota archaeon]
MRYKQELAALIIFLIISIAFVYPVFQNIKNWGIHDWDQHLMLNAMPKETILEFGQFPLWSPYYCGGNVMLANPQSSFLSPLFVFVLIFGELTGLKLLIFIYLVTGLFGMFLLARHLKIPLIPSYLTAFLFMLSGLYAMHISVGHTVWMQMALIPYVFLFYLKSLNDAKFLFLAALFMAFIFLGGGIYPLLLIALFLVFYSALITIKDWRKSKAKYLRSMAIVFLLFVLLGSVKLIPMLEFAKDHSYVKKDVQDNDIGKMIEALTFRDITSRMGYMYDYRINGYTEAIWNWHEYHAYIGFLPLLLFLMASILLFRKEWPLIVLAILFFLIAWGDNAIINIWGLLRQLPFISDLHGSSRFLAMFIFPASLIIGKAAAIFVHKKMIIGFKNKKFNFLKIILILLVLAVFIDLFLVNSQLFAHSFVVKPIKIEKQEFAQVTGVKEKTQYPTFLANLGLVNCFEKVKPELKAIPKYDTKTGAIYTNYIGESYILESNNTQQITYFSPNKVKVKANESGTLVLNQNYAKGWKIKDGKTKNVNGLIGAMVEANQELTFYYLPNSFLLGLFVSMFTLIAAAFYISKASKKRG